MHSAQYTGQSGSFYSIKGFSDNDLSFFGHFKLITIEKFADFLFLMMWNLKTISIILRQNF